MKQIIILVSALTVFHSLYLTTSYFFNYDILLVTIIISLIILIIISIVLLRKTNTDNNQQPDKQLYHSLYLKADTLLNTFFQYFDNSFLLIHSIFKKSDYESREKKFTDYNEYLTKLYEENNIALYLESIKKSNGVQKKSNGVMDTQINDFIFYSDRLINMVSTIEKKLFNDTMERLEIYQRKEEYNTVINRLLIEYGFFSQLISEFFNTIIAKISQTSRPISEEIFTIKQNTTQFVQNVSKWENDLTSNNSQNNFDKVIEYYNRQNKEFNDLFNKINNVYAMLEKKLFEINELMARITVNSAEIENIAEKINILSINASIESARASEHGKGFKVITEEIKKFSDITKTLIKNILQVIGETKNNLNVTIEEFNADGKQIKEKVNVLQNDFQHFYEILNKYYDNFKDIFTSVSFLIGEITQHIGNFNPIFQLHEISIQELENLKGILLDFMKNHRDQMTPITDLTDEESRQQILEDMINFFKEKAISNIELEILNNITKQYHLEGRVDLRLGKEGIEIF